eukprot:6349961-Karenia_brevis.AAC.1
MRPIGFLPTARARIGSHRMDLQRRPGSGDGLTMTRTPQQAEHLSAKERSRNVSQKSEPKQQIGQTEH